MLPIEVLTSEEKAGIGSFIDTVISENVSTKDRAPIEQILKEWNQVKGSLLEMMGGKLILSTPIKVKISEEELANKMSKALCDTKFYNEIYRIIQHVTNYDNWLREWSQKLLGEEAEGPYSGKYWEWKSKAEFLISPNAWAENKFDFSPYYDCSSTHILFPKPDGTTMKIISGTKLMKVLSRIAKEWNFEKEFEEFRLIHSQVLNDDGLEGILHLSIHPLDYLTASVNDCNWHSCMNLFSGEYRRGVVEMMNSPYVVCAYLTSGKNSTMNLMKDFQWNNKKWREFFIVKPSSGIFAIKGYPYWNRDLEKACLDWLKNLCNFNLGITSFEDKLTDFSGDCGFLTDNNNDKRVADLSTIAMYNDFCYEHHYAYLNEDPSCLRFCYSGEATCLHCGRLVDFDEFDGESALCCDNCAPIIRCSCCDERIHLDSIYYIDDMPYCEYCVQDLPVCSFCGETHTEENVRRYLISDEDKNVRFFNICACNYCDEDNENFNQKMVKDLNYEFDLIPLNAFTSRGIKRLGYDNYEVFSEDVKKVSIWRRGEAVA